MSGIFKANERTFIMTTRTTSDSYSNNNSSSNNGSTARSFITSLPELIAIYMTVSLVRFMQQMTAREKEHRVINTLAFLKGL